MDGLGLCTPVFWANSGESLNPDDYRNAGAGMRSLEDTIKSDQRPGRAEETLIYEDKHVKVFEINRVVRNHANFVMESGVMYRTEFEHPSMGTVSRFIDFHEDRGTGVPGITNAALVAILLHRLGTEAGQKGSMDRTDLATLHLRKVAEIFSQD